MEVSAFFNHPPSAVFCAITQADSLQRWLTEHARVSLSEGIFELWGRYLPDAPSAPATRLIEFQQDKLLRFIWSSQGTEREMSITLAPVKDGTQLAVTAAPSSTRLGQVGAADFWALSLENLQRLLAGGSDPLFCDYALPAVGAAEMSVEIAASAEKVWATLIEPRELERYIAKAASVEPSVGGRYDFGWNGGGPIKILEIQRNRKLSYSWHYEHKESPEPETVVTWTLDGSGGRTRLTLVHSGFTPKRLSNDYRTGWAKFMNDIKSLAEMGNSWQPVRLADVEVCDEVIAAVA
jgi:uncharacterized protein YndB with AHSA1/START domain